MDDYFLNRDDWDTLVELGLDEYKDDVVLKQISTATKTALTRKYNAADHPIAFHKATDLGKIPKKLATQGPAPDLEEAFEVDEDVPDEPETGGNAEDEDVSKDSLIKVPKKGKGAGAPAKAKAKSKAKKS